MWSLEEERFAECFHQRQRYNQACTVTWGMVDDLKLKFCMLRIMECRKYNCNYRNNNIHEKNYHSCSSAWWALIVKCNFIDIQCQKIQCHNRIRNLGSKKIFLAKKNYMACMQAANWQRTFWIKFWLFV